MAPAIANHVGRGLPRCTVRHSEIWGGIGDADLDICTSGIDASVYSAACGGQRGGDVFYVSVCSKDLITRVVVADVRGHGQQVSHLSSWLYEEIQAHIDVLDGSSLLRSLNRKLCSKGFEALTTAAVVWYYSRNSKLYVSSAGHPPCLLRRNSRGPWMPMLASSTHEPSNLPLGVMASTDFGMSAISVEARDRVAVYTDGITDLVNENGEEFGEQRLCAVLEQCGGLDLSATKRCLVGALRAHAGQAPFEDDHTLMLIEISPRAGFFPGLAA
jgi:sigma-B regulation protein RsbU (phosphoserine phosphatase)